MIQMQLTSAGLAAVAGNSALTFTRFVAGSGTSDNETVAEACQDVPIVNSQTFIAGQSYTINGQPTTVDYNALEITGMLSSVQAQAAYSWTELALMARISAGEEFAFAYGAAVNNAFYVDPAEPVTYVLPFSVIFSDTPNVTVNATEAGVPWTDFLSHQNATVADGVHGLRVTDGDLVVNGVSVGVASLEELDARTTNVLGVNMLVDALPSNVMDYVGVTAYLRSEQTCYCCRYSEEIAVGDYVVSNAGDWQRCDSDTEGALLVIADGNTPEEGEIVWSEAQRHFCGWSSLGSVESRLQALENSTSPYVKYKDADEREYNSEWVSRMTGAGTVASPYLIHTPYDFNAIRTNLTANYVLMNDLDFSEAIGIEVSLSDGGLVYGAVDTEAPLYNDGQGWMPIGVFQGVLDGNGKALRGLVCCRNDDAVGIFSVLNGAKISNLTVKNSVIVNSKAGGYMGTIAGKTATSSCYLDSVISYATVYNSSATGESKVGGIIGNVDTKTYFNRVAFHGTASALYWNEAVLGGIDAWGAKSCEYVCCCNTANLQGKRASGISDDNTIFKSCYNVGLLSGANTYDLSKSVNKQVSNCYCLDGCAQTIGGVALTEEELQSAEAVDLLNAGLETPVWTVVKGSFPALDFELLSSRSLDSALQVAVLDKAGKEVLPAGVDLSTLVHLPDRVKVLEGQSAVETLTAYEAVEPRRIVAFDGDSGKYYQAASGKDKVFGVSKTSCAADSLGKVVVSGRAIVTVGEAVAAGDYLTGCTVDAVSGLAKVASDGDYIVGMALESAAAGGNVLMMVSPGRLYQPKEYCCAEFVSGSVLIADRVMGVSNIGRVKAAGSTNAIVGISTEKLTKVGVLTRVAVSGVHQVECDTNTITAGDYVGAIGTGGLAVSVTASGRYYVGIALSDSADGYVNVLICPGRIP